MLIAKLLTNTVLLSLLPTTTTLGPSSEPSVSMATPGDDDIMPSLVGAVEGVVCLTTDGGLYPGGGIVFGGVLVMEFAAGGTSSFSSETTCTCT